jgi:hypothetical protein
MKTTLRLSAAALIGFLVLGFSSLATTPATSADGKELYREYCKGCHEEGSPNGEYTPMTLIQDQWTRFFDRKYERTHKSVIDETHGGKPVTETISPEDLELIREFAIEGAADSEHPMTCG